MSLGGEVGRVHIKVVPDFSGFHRKMLAELKEWDKKHLNWHINVNSDNIKKVSNDLNKVSKDASKNMSKTINKELSKVEPKSLIGNRGRLVRRLGTDLERVLSKMEFNIGLVGLDDAVERDALDRTEKRLRKMLSEITSELDMSDFLSKANRLESELDFLSKRAVELDPRKRYEQRLAEWLDAEKKYTALQQQEAARRFNLTLARGQAIKDYFSKITPSESQINNKVWVKQYKDVLAGFKENLKVKVPVSLDEKVQIDKLYAKIEALEKALEVEIPVDFNIKQTAIARLKAEMKVIQAMMRETVSVGNKQNGLDIGQLIPKFGTGFNPAAWGVILGGILLVAAPLIGLITTAALTLPGLIASIAAPVAAVALGFDGIKKAAENAGLTKDGGLGDVFVKLREDVASVFEGKLTEPFKQFGAAVSGWVEPLKTVAGGTSDIISGMINAITSEIGSTKIAETFTAIGQELSKSFAPGIEDFTAALINLAHEFTTGGALEGVGNWFRETMADFKEWTANTDLTEQFSNLGETLKTVLDTLGDMAVKGLEFVGDPQKMEGFIETLKGFGEALQEIVNISNEVGAVWENIMPAFNFGQAIVDVMQGNGKSAWRNFKEGFSGSAKESGPEIGAALNDTIKSGFEAGLALGNPLQGLTEASNAELDRLAYEIAQAGTQGVEQLKQAITAGDIETGVAEQIQAKVGAAVTGATQALVPLKEGLQSDIDAALAPLGDIAGRVGAAFNNVPQLIQGSLGQIPGIVQQAMGTLAVDAEAAMKGVSDAVITHCAIAVNTATTEAPRIAEPFKALSGQMGQVGADMMQGLADGIAGSAGIAAAAAATAASQVLQAAKDAVHSKSPSKDFMVLGEDMNKGTAIGLQNSTEAPISAIREVMQAIKDVFGSAEGINLNFYMGDAAKSMSSLATSSKEFRNNMVEAGTSPAVSSGIPQTQETLDDIKRRKAEIDLRIAELQAQKNQTADKAAKAGLTAEIDQLRIQKERLDLLKEENGLQEERKTAIQQLSDTIATNIVDMIKMPGEFAKTTANAAMQDFGISGSGALPTIANWAMDAGTNFIFNVNNMDDAIQGQQAQQRKQTAGLTSR